MLTKEQVLRAIRDGRKKSECLDFRDFERLCEYFSPEVWHYFGFKLKEGAEPPSVIKEWTEENIKKDLEKDLAFAFRKALDKRGISSSLMYSVVKMWLWILEDPLQDFEEYAYYGLPLFKAVAVKYGFPNPIGDDTGSELKYSDEEE